MCSPTWTQHSPVCRASHIRPHPLLTMLRVSLLRAKEDTEALPCLGALPPPDTILLQTWPPLPRSPLCWAGGRPHSACVLSLLCPSSHPALFLSETFFLSHNRKDYMRYTRKSWVWYRAHSGHSGGEGCFPPRSSPCSPAQAKKWGNRSQAFPGDLTSGNS